MQSKEDIISAFNPNGPGIRGQLFGLPFAPENSEVIIVPVPWDVTVSYRGGSSLGPDSILAASYHVDLFSKDIPDAWKLGITMLSTPKNIAEQNNELRSLAVDHISKVEHGEKIEDDDLSLEKINRSCEDLIAYVKSTTQKYLNEGKIVGVVGGDHSTPLGFIRALGEKYERFAVLQIDAHADLRKAYEGFTYSHGSIMYNVLKSPAVGKLIQVGIRDLCDEEANVIQRAMGRVVTFYDEDIKAAMYNGKNWDQICTEIIQQLPAYVYISFDVDGMDPKLCPNTGTPVAGGFDFYQIIYLLKKIVKSGKKIIGFDISEISGAHGEWDANVGARLLYQLCNWTAVSHKKLMAR